MMMLMTMIMTFMGVFCIPHAKCGVFDRDFCRLWRMRCLFAVIFCHFLSFFVVTFIFVAVVIWRHCLNGQFPSAVKGVDLAQCP